MEESIVRTEISEVIPGVEYYIKDKSGRETILSFMHSKDGKIYEGLTNEDLVNVLILRIEALQRKRRGISNYKILSQLGYLSTLLSERKRRKGINKISK